MKTSILITWLFICFACSNKEKGAPKNINYHSLKEVPPRVKKQLESSIGRIADTSENWNCCCSQDPDLPSNRFLEASQQGRNVELKYQTGGFFISTHSIVFELKE